QVRNSLVYGNRNPGQGNNPGAGIYIGGTNVKVYNNTVYNNEYIGIQASSGSAIVKNNIVYINSGYGDLYNPAGAVASNNLTNTNVPFANAPPNDLHLLSSS